MKKSKLHTIVGCIPFKSLKESGHIISKLKKDFKNKAKIDIFDGIVYYEYQHEPLNN